MTDHNHVKIKMFLMKQEIYLYFLVFTTITCVQQLVMVDFSDKY